MHSTKTAYVHYEGGLILNNKPTFSIVKDEFNIEVFCPESEQVYILKLVKKALKSVKNKASFGNKIILFHNTHLIDPFEHLRLVNYIERGYTAHSVVEFLEKIQGYTEITLLDWNYFTEKERFSVLRSKRKNINKRVADIINATILIILTLPITIITALLIKLESKGPVFFRQKRVGLFNKEFSVIKFRSMVTDAEKNGPQWAKKNDSRVTKVGAFIRKTRIDEIPQLLNVLKGEMSLIGPRPERKVFIEKLKAEIPFYAFRHCIKPGVTGLAQVKYSYGASIEDGKWKHRYDLYYIKNQNTLLDIKIIFMTIMTVIKGLGR
jgi:exopolysaccharide biosynthesis polyprenyl glycosylphosphotransferase